MVNKECILDATQITSHQWGQLEKFVCFALNECDHLFEIWRCARLFLVFFLWGKDYRGEHECG